MDIRRNGWFGQLVVSGVSQPRAHRGSIMHIIAESLKDMQELRIRTNEEGESEILIRIRNRAFETNRAAAIAFDKAFEVEQMLEGAADEPDMPASDESYENYYTRLIKSGYSQPAAMMIAGEWFGRPTDITTQLWLSDLKAIRFRELNSRDEAFNAALPSEYESLKNYVKTTYPEFCEHITFRTA